MKATMAAERTYDRTWEEIETMLTRAEKDEEVEEFLRGLS